VVKEGSFRGEGTIDLIGCSAEQTPKERTLPLPLNCLLNDVIEGKKGRNDGKTMKKRPAATGTPQGKEKVL
jgi:hypothetical protein